MSYIYIYKLWLRISEGFLVEGQKREERYMTARVILCVGVSLRRHVIEQLQKKRWVPHVWCISSFTSHLHLASWKECKHYCKHPKKRSNSQILLK